MPKLGSLSVIYRSCLDIPDFSFFSLIYIHLFLNYYSLFSYSLCHRYLSCLGQPWPWQTSIACACACIAFISTYIHILRIRIQSTRDSLSSRVKAASTCVILPIKQDHGA
ncbi:hypothetical protein BJX65DRAFT_113520 [Aspergillus insuetus]